MFLLHVFKALFSPACGCSPVVSLQDWCKAALWNPEHIPLACSNRIYKPGVKNTARKNTVEQTYVGLKISNVRSSWEIDEHRKQVRIITNELVCLQQPQIHFIVLHFSQEQWEVMSSSLHHAVENLGFVMTDQPDKLGLPPIASFLRAVILTWIRLWQELMQGISEANVWNKEPKPDWIQEILQVKEKKSNEELQVVHMHIKRATFQWVSVFYTSIHLYRHKFRQQLNQYFPPPFL